MGLANRDYFRDEERRYGGGGGGDFLADTPTVRTMIVLTIVVFFLQVLVTRPLAEGFRESLVDEWFGLNVRSVLHGEVWRLVSYAFLHSRAGLWHLIMNMLMVWFFGVTIERMYGSREFLWFYLTAAALGGLAHVLWGLALPEGMVVGASGVVMAIMMLYAIHFPRQQILLMGLIPVEIWLLLTFYVLADLYPVVLAISGEAPIDQIAHIVHLAGLLYGWLYYHYNIRWEKLADSFSSRVKSVRARRKFKVYSPDPEPSNMEAEVDRILAKISAEGSESLTPREQATLAKASEAYKKKM